METDQGNIHRTSEYSFPTSSKALFSIYLCYFKRILVPTPESVASSVSGAGLNHATSSKPLLSIYLYYFEWILVPTPEYVASSLSGAGVNHGACFAYADHFMELKE